ncbi:MAG: nucleotide sugar dehydrogenase [candidate division Zixibacteria bacterium]|nr:nucleotide sugar dehydrogenase [candidate division Zixibacteria bacterium]
MKKKLLQKIKDRSAKIGIIGLGYVGLPLAVEFAENGFKVLGYDVWDKKVKLINSGKSDIDDIPDTQVAPLVKTGYLKATTDDKILSQADCVFICVPTPLSKTKDPDISYILSACDSVVKYMHKDMLVVLESTTYPGTTDEVIMPRLEASGLKAGKDFYLAFSPERVDPGNAKYSTKNTPRVVGGITNKCTQMAKICYEQVIPNIYPVSSTRAAEMVKLLENTFRSVNIGLVNEVALMCRRLDMDVWEIIDAAATKPFGFMPFYPGPGLGGHCIPIDPHYLSWKLKTLNYYARFIELAGDINSHMPEWVIERITLLLNDRGKSVKNAKLYILGVAYKKNIQDIRESPALDVLKLLDRLGAKLSYTDPYVPIIKWDNHEMKSTKLTAGKLKKSDMVIILTDHMDFNYEWIVENANLIFDTRNATARVIENRDKIIKL